MNKQEFIKVLADKTGLKQADVTKLVNAYADTVMEALKNGDDVRLLGFGRFCAAERNARTGRNPHTGEIINIPASRMPRFTPSNNFKDLLKTK